MRLASYVVGGAPRAAALAADQTLVPVTDLFVGVGDVMEAEVEEIGVLRNLVARQMD